MALYIPHSIFHLARLLHVRPETFGPYYVHIPRMILAVSTIFFSHYVYINNEDTFSFIAQYHLYL